MVTSERLLRSPLDARIGATLALCAASAAAASVSACVLAVRHLRAGQRVSGTLAPARRSMLVIRLVLAIPSFAAIALLSLVTVEVVRVWMFLLTLLLCRVIAEIPMLFLDVAGGPVRLQLSMREYRERGGEALRLYGHVPLCCLRPLIGPKVPAERDLPRLRLGVEQFTVIQPVLAFLELFLQMEGLEGATFVTVFGGRRPVVTALRILSNLTAMSSMRGLATLVAAMSKRGGQDLHLAEKQRYGQCFLLGMHLIPTLLHGVYTWLFASSRLANGYAMTAGEQARLSLCVVVCLATLLCARAARRAFPVDATLYPELEAPWELAQPLALQHVRFCPFCGSHRLRSRLDGDLLECRACCRGGFPLQLEARMGRAGGHTAPGL